MFNSVVYFYRGELSDFHNLLLKKGFDISTEQESADGLCFDFGSIQAVWIETSASTAVKAHELLHVVLNICDNQGIDRNDDEVLCYMLEYLLKSL